MQQSSSTAATEAPAGNDRHHHVGGSKAPGDCSAECACGVTFAGFDTLAEASALLDQHIEQATSTTHTTWYLLLTGDLAGQYVTLWGTWQRAVDDATARFGNGWHGLTDEQVDIEGLRRFTDRRVFEPEVAYEAAIREHAQRGHALLPASELAPGDWIWHDGRVRQVRYTEAYQVGTRTDILIVFGGADIHRVPADEPQQIATAADIEAEAIATRRAEMVQGLRALADLIAERKLPVPRYTLTISGGLASEAAVRELAELAGLETRESSGYLRASWQYPADRDQVPAVEWEPSAPIRDGDRR